MFNDTQTIGTGLLGLGLLFVFLGVCLLFDRTLLTIGAPWTVRGPCLVDAHSLTLPDLAWPSRAGNVLFLSGLCVTMGMSRTMRFFSKKARDMGLRGVACFLGRSARATSERPVTPARDRPADLTDRALCVVPRLISSARCSRCPPAQQPA